MWRFRPFTDADLGLLVRWRQEAHVLRWFPRAYAGVDEARQLLEERLQGDSPVQMWIASLDGRPIGFLQSFPVAADPDLAVRVRDQHAVCFDFLIGDPESTGRGLGSSMIAGFCRQVLIERYPAAPRFIALPDARNHRSIAALGRAGFERGLWIQPDAAEYAEVTCSAPRAAFTPDSSTLGP
ncbi:hypothetical protein BHE97_14735 [Aeromicrobium sp. PE09-221]|uniref:GNAT family N-acetyltransferase n=1 Tax=Aeromicrobium sp. PE09-221 TaxID=1898043 RepID=UPI000B3E5146|nr:GNAT family N-acetyltransferase [Aeromicrobium sp. PE09-221]OUZ07955.1 hypothetical protein BHE97_14735 [Aeromicrobium sp. PE09-221]